MTKINVDVKLKEGVSAYIAAPFDIAKEELEKQGYEIISLEENAELRMQEGTDSFISQNGNWVREGIIYVPKKGTFLTPNSPIMKNPKEATNCHRKSEDYYLSNKQVEKALEDSVQITGKSIPTNRFADNKITVYAFGNSAEQYGKFLREAGIKKMSVWLADTQNKPFARQLWFGRPDYWSGLVGCGGWYLVFVGRVRGVRKNAEGIAKNIGVYSFKDIQKALELEGLTGLEEILKRGLEQ